jgi:hypothetical protein
MTLQIFLGYRTDSAFNRANKTWDRMGSSIIIANVGLRRLNTEYPNDGYSFYDEHRKLYDISNPQRRPFFDTTHVLVNRE